MERFARSVGETEPVTVLGGGTKGDLGGARASVVTEVRAPTGIVEVRARELVVVVGAGTTVSDLEDELASIGQRCGLGGPSGATVGGVIASGHGGVHTRALGPVRDLLLGASAVDAWGRVIKAGGATVKNVSGFDLCRLWTGSLGTLALLGVLTLRTRPVWTHEQWVCGEADPFEVETLAPDATSVLWDGTTVWVHLGGHPDDVVEQCGRLELAGCDRTIEEPPPLPSYRHCVDPATFRDRPLGPSGGPLGSSGRTVLEMGVGVVHSTDPPKPRPMARRLWELHREVKHRFDPTGRLNPGRSPLAGAVPEQ